MKRLSPCALASRVGTIQFVTVVKVERKTPCSALPAISSTSLTSMKYRVPKPSSDDGVNVAVVPFTVNVPGTNAVSVSTLKVDAVTVAGAMGSENTIATVVFLAIPWNPIGGVIDTRIGGVRSPVGPSFEHATPQARAARKSHPTV